MTFAARPLTAGKIAQLLAADLSRTRLNNQCYSGIQLHSNGNAYKVRADGTDPSGDSPLFQWRVSGESGDFYVRATLNSGVLDGFNSGTNPTTLPMSTTRTWGVLDNIDDATNETASVTIEIATESGMTNIVASRTYTFDADWL